MGIPKGAIMDAIVRTDRTDQSDIFI